MQHAAKRAWQCSGGTDFVPSAAGLGVRTLVSEEAFTTQLYLSLIGSFSYQCALVDLCWGAGVS